MEYQGKSIVAVLIAASLSACGASGPQFRKEVVVPQADPVLYVYRPSRFVASGYEARLQVDELPIRKLKNGGFFRIPLAAGSHSIKTIKRGFRDWGAEEKTASFVVEKGQVLFMKYNVEGAVFPTGISALPVGSYSTLKLHSVPAEIAEKELAELNESEQ